MPSAKVAMLHPLLAMHRSNPAMRRPLLPIHRPFVAMRRPLLPIHRPFVAMRRPFPALLHAFAATRCEGEDTVHEESFGHHVRHGVLDPYRARGSERVGSSSERATTRPAHVGMRREQLETPHEERTMPTAKPRRPRRHPPSLQRFVLEELVPFTKQGKFSMEASRDFHLFYVGRDDVHVSNGAFLRAAVLEGYRVVRCYPTSPNAFLNIRVCKRPRGHRSSTDE
jgi:hypothetical protein